MNKMYNYDKELADSLEHMSCSDLSRYRYDTYYLYNQELPKSDQLIINSLLKLYNEYEIKYLKHITLCLKLPKFIQKFYLKYINKLYIKTNIFYDMFYRLLTNNNIEKEKVLNTLIYLTWMKRFKAAGIPIKELDEYLRPIV